MGKIYRDRHQDGARQIESLGLTRWSVPFEMRKILGPDLAMPHYAAFQDLTPSFFFGVWVVEFQISVFCAS